MNNLKLKNNLRVYRAIRKITQEELGIAVGVTRKTINTIENDIYVPSTLLALKIAKYFEVPVESVFFLAEEEV